MTQLEIIKFWFPDLEDALLEAALERARLGILELRFPFGFEANQELEAQYMGLQLEVAIEIISKIGAEGETAHSENGVSRTYENAGISNSLKRRVVPMAKVVTLDAKSDAESE